MFPVAGFLVSTSQFELVANGELNRVVDFVFGVNTLPLADQVGGWLKTVSCPQNGKDLPESGDDE